MNDICAYQPCSAKATKSCGRCMTVSYCCREHQTGDWKVHKKCCFAPGTQCTRCLSTIEPGSMVYQVPHPPHLQRCLGSSSIDTKKQKHMACEVCQVQYKMEKLHGSDDEYKIVGDGATGFCFQGNHTTKVIRPDDGRRVFPGYVHLEWCEGNSNDIQKKIDKLPRNTRILVISAKEGEYADESNEGDSFTLARKLPNLEHLTLNNVPCHELVLTEATTPVLSVFEVYELPKKCNATIQPPLLEILKVYGCARNWLYKTVRHATKLVYFDSQDLCCVNKLFFCSNQLEVVDLHRATKLKELKIYAPCLTKLNLQECYHVQLETIEIMDDYEGLRAKCYENHRHSTFVVNTTDCEISQEAQTYLEEHPRVQLKSDDPEHSFFPAGLMEMLGIPPPNNGGKETGR